ncbi:MAG: DUF2938 family protein [Bacteroidota bacterium]|nr:DUF2938 family protein [Bacteroidota bacterium]
MKQFRLFPAIVAGIAGTAVMSVMMAIAPMMGLPPMNVPSMLSNFMGMPLFLGWVMHFMVGSILAVQYAAFASSRLPGPPVLRGMLFGLAPWLMAQVIVNPMMGAGVFAMNAAAPVGMVMGSLLGHLVFGAVIGKLYAFGKENIPLSVHA